MERFEPSTLSGLVFETSAYTVPPHRLISAFTVLMIPHPHVKVNSLWTGWEKFRCSTEFSDGSEFLITLL